MDSVKKSVTSLFVGWWSWCMLTQEVLHWYHARSCRDHFEHSSDAWHSRETCLLSFRLTATDVFLSAIQSVVLLVSVLVVESSTGVDKEVMMHPLTTWQERKKQKLSTVSLNFPWVNCSATQRFLFYSLSQKWSPIRCVITESVIQVINKICKSQV